MAVTAGRAIHSRFWLTKVPAITATFWIIKVLSTTIGETFADYLSVNVGLGTAVTYAMMIAVLAVALGNAAGDLATGALSVCFRNDVLIFDGLSAATWLANRTGVNQVATFWIAYILTRPLGASLGDLLTQDKTFGGLALGASLTSL